MATSREKAERLIDIVMDQFNIKTVNMLFVGIDVRTELRKRLARVSDAQLDELLVKIRKVVDES
jgi:hypothetical protein